MNILELASCIPYALGHPRMLGVSARHEMKQKNENVCERNFDKRLSEELPWRVVQQITSDEDHDCFRALSISLSRRVVQLILPKLGSVFSRANSFCFENWIFYSHSA